MVGHGGLEVLDVRRHLFRLGAGVHGFVKHAAHVRAGDAVDEALRRVAQRVRLAVVRDAVELAGPLVRADARGVSAERGVRGRRVLEDADRVHDVVGPVRLVRLLDRVAALGELFLRREQGVCGEEGVLRPHEGVALVGDDLGQHVPGLGLQSLRDVFEPSGVYGGAHRYPDVRQERALRRVEPLRYDVGGGEDPRQQRLAVEGVVSALELRGYPRDVARRVHEATGERVEVERVVDE